MPTTAAPSIATSTLSGQPKAPSATAKSDFKVQVLNGTGIPGQAKLWSDALAAIDLKVANVGKAPLLYRQSVAYYAGESRVAAETIAAFAGAMAQPMPWDSEFDIVIVIGKDLVREASSNQEGPDSTQPERPPEPEVPALERPTSPESREVVAPEGHQSERNTEQRGSREQTPSAMGTLIGAVASGDLHSRIVGAEVILNTGQKLRTNEKGIYQLVLTPGDYVVSAMAPDGRKSQRNCAVLAKEANWCSIVIPK